MVESTPMITHTDRLDRQIIHALIAHPRCPFARMAQVLDASEQTIARRYRRLREAGLARVRGLRGTPDPMQDWFVRVQVQAGAAAAVAGARSTRPDVSWVSIGAGGVEV